MSDNGTAANAFSSVDPRIAIILAVVAVMTTLMVWLLKQARDSWDGAQASGNVHRVNLAFLYAVAVLLGAGSVFTTAFILMATVAFASSEFAYPVVALMVVEVALLMLAPVAVVASHRTGRLTEKEWLNSYRWHWAKHFLPVVLFVCAIVQLSLRFPHLWATLKWGNTLIAAGVSLLTLFGEAWLMWTMAGVQQQKQGARGGVVKMYDKARAWLQRRDAMIWYSRLVRVALFGLCVGGSFLFWGWVLGKWWQSEGSRWPAIVALSFGTYAVIQTSLRYVCTPTPEIKVDEESPVRLGPHPEFAVQKVAVWNYDVPRWLRPLVLRDAPEGCRIRFRYTRVTERGEEMALKGQWLHGRWDDTPEPLTQIITLKGPVVGYDLKTAVANRRLTKLFASEKGKHPDAYPFGVAFAMKKEGEADFYHFNDDSYQWSDWRNPDWVLGPGTYRVDVRLTGSGLVRAKTATFRLRNPSSSLTEWVLEEWHYGDGKPS